MPVDGELRDGLDQCIGAEHRGGKVVGVQWNEEYTGCPDRRSADEVDRGIANQAL